MPLQRVKTEWSGFKGAPGFANFYFSVGTPPPLTALRTFFEGVKSFMPTGLTITYPASGDIINETNGQITDAWTTAGVSTTVCTGSSTYSGASGAVVEWRSATVLDGRRPVGKTFLVPLATIQYQSDGTVLDATVSAIKTAADTFVAAVSGQFFVWHRPIRDPEPPHNITRVGAVAAVTSTKVPDMAAVLRSRRQ